LLSRSIKYVLLHFGSLSHLSSVGIWKVRATNATQNSEHASAGAAREDRASEFSGSFPSAWLPDSFMFMDPS